MKPLLITPALLSIILLIGSLAMAETIASPSKSPTQNVLEKQGTAGGKSDSSKEAADKRKRREFDRIKNLLDKEQYQQAVDEWEHSRTRDTPPLTWESLAWKLAEAYIQLSRYDDAIKVYQRFYVSVDSLSIMERADIGEELIFGELGARPNKKLIPMGKAQCTLCHRFEKDSHLWAGPNLYGIVRRARALVTEASYLNRSRATAQPEAFPGSGNATTAIEYLAESKVCPSCYITPGTWFHRDDWKESPQPSLQKPPISLTVDEMIAIDTWLFLQEGEQPPSLEAMRAAYDKFLKKEDRAGSFDAIKLAALYDARNDIDKAIRLIEDNYDGVVRQNLTPLSLSPELSPYPSMVDEDLSQWRNDPARFVHLKQNSTIAQRFPHLLRPDS
jgi:tetratricopeptide (TPR) repeat protein